jgi:tetratricopeptide (TPR) repeat protein
MRKTRKYIIFYSITIFSFLFLSEINGQDFQKTLEFADRNYENGNLDLAIKTYQRLAFFCEDRQATNIYLKIAEISAEKGNYQSAQTYYGFAINLIENDSIKNELIFKKAFSQMLDKNFQFALIDLFSIDSSRFTSENKLNFYLGTCYFGLEDFETSKLLFQRCIDPADSSKLNILFSKKNIYSHSPKKARIMSTFIPGSGQIYAGYYRAGINSLLLTGALLAAGINSGINYDPLYAIFSVAPWYQRYFTGGYTKAEKLAETRTKINRNKSFNKILELIAENADWQ